MKRYGGNIDSILSLSFFYGKQFLQKFEEFELEEEAEKEWLAILPLMALKLMKYTSKQSYIDLCLGRNIDKRPTAVILEEVGKAIEKLDTMKGG